MTEAIAIRNRTGSVHAPSGRVNGGFSLIEALVSLLILSVILLGLQAGMITAITMNTENLLRNEAVDLAHERMDRYRITPGAPPLSETIDRQVRNYDVTYTLNNDYDDITDVLDMTVEWEFQNEKKTLEYTSHVGG